MTFIMNLGGRILHADDSGEVRSIPRSRFFVRDGDLDEEPLEMPSTLATPADMEDQMLTNSMYGPEDEDDEDDNVLYMPTTMVRNSKRKKRKRRRKDWWRTRNMDIDDEIFFEELYGDDDEPLGLPSTARE